MTTLTWDRHRGHAVGYDVVALGFNYRIDEPRAALGHGAARAPGRRERAAAASSTRATASGSPASTASSPTRRRRGARHLFTVVLDDGIDRDAFRAALAERGVQTSLHYPPVHRFSIYADGAPRAAADRRLRARTITLPLFAGHDRRAAGPRGRRAARRRARSQSAVCAIPSCTPIRASQPSRRLAFSTLGQRRTTSTSKVGRCSSSRSAGSLPAASQQMARDLGDRALVGGRDVEVLVQAGRRARRGHDPVRDVVHVRERPGLLAGAEDGQRPQALQRLAQRSGTAWAIPGSSSGISPGP